VLTLGPDGLSWLGRPGKAYGVTVRYVLSRLAGTLDHWFADPRTDIRLSGGPQGRA